MRDISFQNQLKEYMDKCGEPTAYTLDMYNNTIHNGQIKVKFEQRGHLGYVIKDPKVSFIKAKTRESISAPNRLAELLTDIEGKYLAWVSFIDDETRVCGRRKYPVESMMSQVPTTKEISFNLTDGAKVNSFSRKINLEEKKLLYYIDLNSADIKLAAIVSGDKKETLDKNLVFMDDNVLSAPFKRGFAGSLKKGDILKKYAEVYPNEEIVIENIEVVPNVEHKIQLQSGESLDPNFPYNNITQMFVIFQEKETSSDNVTVKLERDKELDEYKLCIGSSVCANIFDAVANAYEWKNDAGNAVNFEDIISQLTEIEKNGKN